MNAFGPPVTVIAEAEHGSFRWQVGKKTFQVKGRVALVLFGNEYHIALQGNSVRPDGSYRPLIEHNMIIPNIHEWHCVYSNKFLSDNTAARLVKIEFKPNATGTEWIQVTIPIKIKPSGVVEDPGKEFGRAVKALFHTKSNMK